MRPGDVVRRTETYVEDDHFGRTVNIAARIASQAGPDQVYETDRRAWWGISGPWSVRWWALED